MMTSSKGVTNDFYGFSFHNYLRNKSMMVDGFSAPMATKTGTTVVGIVFKDGVVLGADTRASQNNVVTDKNCAKIHGLAKNIYCCGAGTASDIDKTAKVVAAQLHLLQQQSQKQVRVVAAETIIKQTLYRFQGHIAAAFVLGGVDMEGPRIYSIFPQGSSSQLPFTTMGSGSYAAIGVLDAGWKPNLSEQQGKLLVRDAVVAGILNDAGSGGAVDLCVIRTDSTTEYIRAYEIIEKKGQCEGLYKYDKGTTETLSTNIEIVIESVQYLTK